MYTHTPTHRINVVVCAFCDIISIVRERDGSEADDTAWEKRGNEVPAGEEGGSDDGEGGHTDEGPVVCVRCVKISVQV